MFLEKMIKVRGWFTIIGVSCTNAIHKDVNGELQLVELDQYV